MNVVMRGMDHEGQRQCFSYDYQVSGSSLFKDNDEASEMMSLPAATS